MADQPGRGFSGFLNLKIAKELDIFKGKCQVDPHIPLLMIQFHVSQDLKPLLSKWWFSAFLSAPLLKWMKFIFSSIICILFVISQSFIS